MDMIQWNRVTILQNINSLCKQITDIFKKNTTVDSTGILSESGDKLEARVTNSNRKVVKIQKDNGNSRYSATQYPNGTVVETKVTKRK